MCAGVVIGSNHPPDGKTHHAGKFKRSSVRFSGLLPNPPVSLADTPERKFPRWCDFCGGNLLRNVVPVFGCCLAPIPCGG